MKQLIVIFCVVFFGISLKGIEAKPPKLNEEYLVIDGKQAESKEKSQLSNFSLTHVFIAIILSQHWSNG